MADIRGVRDSSLWASQVERACGVYRSLQYEVGRVYAESSRFSFDGKRAAFSSRY